MTDIDDPDKFNREPPVYFCITCDYEIDASDYAEHDRQGCLIREEEPT